MLKKSGKRWNHSNRSSRNNHITIYQVRYLLRLLGFGLPGLLDVATHEGRKLTDLCKLGRPELRLRGSERRRRKGRWNSVLAAAAVANPNPTVSAENFAFPPFRRAGRTLLACKSLWARRWAARPSRRPARPRCRAMRPRRRATRPRPTDARIDGLLHTFGFRYVMWSSSN